MRAFKHKGTTAAELVKGEDGYSGDGVGMFTHLAARSKQPPKSGPARPQTVRQLIDIQERQLRELYREHKSLNESNPRIVRVRRDIDAKQNFVARLWAELGAEMRRGKA